MKNTFSIKVGNVRSSFVTFLVSHLEQMIFVMAKNNNKRQTHTHTHAETKLVNLIRLFVLVLISIAALAFLWHLLFSGFFNCSFMRLQGKVSEVNDINPVHTK